MMNVTLTAIDDVCAARSAVLVRTWMRSVAVQSRGGFGVVDAFGQLVRDGVGVRRRRYPHPAPLRGSTGRGKPRVFPILRTPTRGRVR